MIAASEILSRSPEEDDHDLWPLEEIDPGKGKFPCCLVWSPLPIVSWLVPYIGHVAICREDGAVLDFSGSNLITVGSFSHGSVARYLQLDRDKCCFPRHLHAHCCKQPFQHSELGGAISWDDALHATSRQFEHKSYNFFTCNAYSFVARCLNRVAYGGSLHWNMVSLALLLMWRGRWVGFSAVIRSFLPFIVVLCGGGAVVGWPFLLGLALFSSILLTWLLVGTYCIKNVIE